MKLSNLKYLLLFAGVFLLAFQATIPELSREERKALRSEARDLRRNPWKLKALKDTLASTQKELSSYRQLYRVARGKEYDFEQLKEVLLLRVADLEKQLAECLKRKSGGNTNTLIAATGIVFRVQIGAFQKQQQDVYRQNNVRGYKLEERGGLLKHTLGFFNHYLPAKTLRDYLLKLGVQKAWVVAFKDGQRINMADALAQTLQAEAKSLNTKGVSYKVRIGDNDKANDYYRLLGNFQQFEESQAFRKYLKSLGIKKVQIIEFIDGQPTSVKEEK
ncbi:hypothetical protein [Microscilla marina]|uniref:SPOR domain-containing protein n=1 Tax=Microscilla marina ATCC 23134 TaxID=313606 RepID=A1ZZK9_MICM2|nr:hypothetical protein [Microscilla marina]EAY24204.1 hypothetical protein M23134_01792 [Microscilla marina ATCC 23134]